MSDHALGVTGLVLGVAGILVGLLASYYFYLSGRERIEPRYLLQYEPILGSSSGAMDEASLLFKGEEIVNLNRCILVIWNRGSRTLTKSAVVDSDKVRVCLPKGSKALGVGIARSSRPAIGLIASIDESRAAVIVDFDFLDKGDGGAIEILYQGDPKLEPTVAGSIRGVPQGLKSVGDALSWSDEELHEEKGTWKGWLPAFAVLFLLTAGSAALLGFSHPLTVVLFTVLGEIILIVLAFGTLFFFFQRAVGFTDLWKEPPGSVGPPRIKID
jgi:hypothetical protein